MIKKYPFADQLSILAPMGDVLLVDYQGDSSETPTMWINAADIAHRVEYQLFETGSTPTGTHVGSAICGRYVWHVYRQ